MRVLHVYRTYFPDAQGGLQESIRQICLATRNFDVESRVFVLSPNPTPKLIQSGEGDIIRSASWWAPASCDLGGLDALAEFKKQTAWADLIHFHFPWPFGDVLNIASSKTKPRVLTYHSDVVKQKYINYLYSPLRAYTMHCMDAIVATSPIYLNTSPVLKKWAGTKKLRMIPLGICEEPSSQVIDDARAKDYLNMHGLENSRYILFLGVLRYYKGVHTLIQAASQIHQKIVVAGSGPEELALKKLSLDLGVKNIVFTGEVTEIKKYALLKNCTALVLPSHLRSEAFGMVLIEACMHSKPMISCEINSGTSYVNINNETGFVVPPENPDQLAHACNHLINNPIQANKMGNAARSRYEFLFSAKALGGNYSKLYAELLIGYRAKE
jgi:glycosyltransferase involved in cell wall biosynthesis